MNQENQEDLTGFPARKILLGKTGRPSGLPVFPKRGQAVRQAKGVSYSGWESHWEKFSQLENFNSDEGNEIVELLKSIEEQYSGK